MMGEDATDDGTPMRDKVSSIGPGIVVSEKAGIE